MVEIICSECNKILNWNEVECCNVCHRPLSCPNCDADFVETFECHTCGINCVDCIYYDESSDAGGFDGDAYCDGLHCKNCADIPDVSERCQICFHSHKRVVCPEASYIKCSCGALIVHAYCREEYTGVIGDCGNCIECEVMLCEKCQNVCAECRNRFCENCFNIYACNECKRYYCGECASGGCPKCKNG